MKQKPQKQQTKELNAQQMALKLKEEGNDAFMKSQYEKAIELYSKAIELDPTNSIYFNNRSQAYYYQDQFEKALEDSSKSIQLNPEYIKAINNKAQILLELAQTQQALDLLNQTIQSYPNEATQQILSKLQEELSKFITLPQDHPEFIKHKQLTNWLIQGKAEFPKLQIVFYSQDYRGVHTTRKVKAHDTILYVPLDHLITLEMAKETTVAKKILQYKLDLLSPKHSYLSTFLLQEKMNPNSFWKPYLDILPETYSSFPIFFNEEDLSLLQGSPFLKQVKEKKQDLQRDYEEIVMVAPEFEQYGFQQFCWARMTASSRIFGITINGQKTDAFVPLADMLNHRRPKQTTWMYSDERKGFIIETDEDIDRCSMVFDSYGRKCNSRFLLNYGFIVEDNDANEVAVTVYRASYDPLITYKEEMTGENIPDTKVFRILADVEGNQIKILSRESNVLEFLGYLRFLLINDIKQLQLLQQIQLSQTNSNDRGGLYKSVKTPPISIDNEIQVWLKIKELCNNQLQYYPNTIEEDFNLLKRSDLTNNQRNCILLRSGEKQILYFFLEMSDRIVKLLTTSVKKELAKLMSKQSTQPYMPYINKILPLLSKRESEKQQ